MSGAERQRRYGEKLGRERPPFDPRLTEDDCKRLVPTMKDFCFPVVEEPALTGGRDDD